MVARVHPARPAPSGRAPAADARARADLLQQLIDHLPAMVAYWDRDCRNVVANAAYVEWFGFRPDDMPGVHIREVLGEAVYAKNLPHIEAVLRGEQQLFDRTLVDTQGRVRHTQASYVPDVVDGEVAGFFVLVTEVTARVEAERAAARVASQLRALARSLPTAFVLLFDHDLRYLLAEGQGLRPFGLTSEGVEGRTLPEVQPDLAPSIEPAYRAALAGATTQGERTVSGRVFSLTAAPVHDERGELIGGMVIGIDVTGERRLSATQSALHHLAMATAARTPLNEVIEQMAGSLRELFDAGLVGVIRFDGVHGTIVSMVPAVPGMVGTVVHAGDGTAVGEVLATERASVMRLAGAEDGLPGRLYEAGVRTAAAVPILVDGRPWGALALGLGHVGDTDDVVTALADFASLAGLAVSSAEAWAELERRSLVDDLTGLANRRAFEARAREEVERARRTGDPLAMAILDLDRFKEVNDRHGHAAGDDVLAAAATRLSAACRQHEVVARLGGEEFALLLPGAGADEAMAAAERVRAAVGARPYRGGLRMTASAGVASMAGDEAAADTLLREADRALYRAKQDGRDRTVCADRT